ncbi:MAG: cation diffusion facilitator family transporter [Thermodesulfobacteriota bacterium]|nr:cation diffusion facilitator family transporter [Thermodesulfobacteriota bacterium]
MPKRGSIGDARSITLVGVCVNILLIGIKFIAGIIGNSHALIADAVHSVSDLFTDAVVFFGIKGGRKPPDDRHQFGHGRIETLSAATVGLILIATALYLGIQAARDIYFQNEYHPTMLALVGAGISIALKETLYHYTLRAGRRIKSQLIVANAWHHRSDALSSVAVFVGVACARIKPGWHVFDTFAVLLVSFLIIKVGLEILSNTFHELSDAAPKPEILNRIKQCALNVDGAIGAHDLRVRTSGGRYQIEVHIVVNALWTVAQGHRVAKAVEKCLIDDFEDIDKVIVHVDPAEETEKQNQ